MSNKDDSLSVSESTGITIPLRNLLAIIFGVAVSVIGYFGIDERIMMLEHELEQAQQYIKNNKTWIDEWESDGILPLDVEQNMRIDHIEWRISKVGL
tara:strand:- start:15420 stop:15710 length:291 start_codon:yes stop_codon:yes gene_type:complete